jgi:hypothetical protein
VQCPRKNNGKKNVNGIGGGKDHTKRNFREKDKPGHKAEDCWENPKNAGSRPSWWKSKTEEAAHVFVDTNIEMTVANIDYCEECIELKADPLETFMFDEDYYDNEYDVMSDDELVNYFDDDEWLDDDEQVSDEELPVNMAKEVVLPCVDKNIQVVTIKEATQIETEESVVHESELLAYNSDHSVAMLRDPNVFVIDPGATMHSTGDSRWMTDLKKTDTFSKVGNGQLVKALGAPSDGL